MRCVFFGCSFGVGLVEVDENFIGWVVGLILWGCVWRIRFVWGYVCFALFFIVFIRDLFGYFIFRLFLFSLYWFSCIGD